MSSAGTGRCAMRTTRTALSLKQISLKPWKESWVNPVEQFLLPSCVMRSEYLNNSDECLLDWMSFGPAAVCMYPFTSSLHTVSVTLLLLLSSALSHSVPGAFKLDHLQPFKPILFWQFPICSIFILGGQFLLPQRGNSEKRDIFQFQKWMRQGVFSAWGIQIGPIGATWAKKFPKIFKYLNLYTGAPFSLYPREEKREEGGVGKCKSANST